MEKWVTGMVLLFIGTVLYGQTVDQCASPYFTVNRYKKFINYGINSGQLQLDFPMRQPYRCNELYKAYKGSQNNSGESFFTKFKKIVTNELNRYCDPDVKTGSGYWNIKISGGYRVGDEYNEKISQPWGAVEGTYHSKHIVLANHTIFDQGLKDDPLFYGDTGEWIWGRSETAYALFKYGSLNFFAGRVYRNFGIPEESSLILSDNPYSYDHYGFEYNSKRFTFSFFTARLNNRQSYDSQAEDTSLVLAKRYFSVQRGEVKLAKDLILGLNQVAIYGGEDRDFEMIYLNPLNLFYVCQRNHSSQISGLWALDLFWKPAPRWTFYGQFLIDDIIVNNEPGQDDRATYPDRFGGSLKIICTDLGIPGTQYSFTYHRISNWTYMSYRTWENYLYYGKSMGFPVNSFEGMVLGFDCFSFFPYQFSIKAGFNRHGEQDLQAVFRGSKDPFPMDVAVNNTFLNTSVTYIPNNRLYCSLNIRHDHFDNYLNMNNNKKDFLSFKLTFSTNLYWNFHF